jgi:hypothetical protein
MERIESSRVSEYSNRVGKYQQKESTTGKKRPNRGEGKKH